MNQSNIIDQSRLISFLEKLEFPQKHFSNEKKFILYTFNSLKVFFYKYKYRGPLKMEHTSDLYQRQLRPDITIGRNNILIELKYNSDLNGIYRLFYQAFKYRRMAGKLIILYNCSSKKKGQLTEEDIDDLESIPPIKDGKPLIKVIQRTLSIN